MLNVRKQPLSGMGDKIKKYVGMTKERFTCGLSTLSLNIAPLLY